MANDDYFIEKGKYFGYPDCCISEFLDRYNRIMNEGAKPLEYWLKFNQTQVDRLGLLIGFVPCESCCGKILNGETTIEGLLSNRVCETPYPHG